MWQFMGYADEDIIEVEDDELEDADQRQTHLKHLMCQQIRMSDMKLKQVVFENTITRKNKLHTQKKKKRKK